MAGPVNDDIRQLITQLDSPYGGEAEEAQAVLTSMGAAVIPVLLDALPSLGESAKLCVLDIVEALHHTAAAPALVPMLRDENDVVRDWTARVLGGLGYEAAIPELLALSSRLYAEEVPPDWTGPVAVRHALTQLGHRRIIAPRTVAAAVKFVRGNAVYPAIRLEDLLRALARADQVILSFVVWRRVGRDGLTRQTHVSSGWQFDVGRSWPDNVREAYKAAQSQAAHLPPNRRRLVVSIEWIDRADVTGPEHS